MQKRAAHSQLCSGLHLVITQLLCVRVALSLPEIVSDEKITPLYLTCPVILHNNCRTTTSSQTEPHLQESIHRPQNSKPNSWLHSGSLTTGPPPEPQGLKKAHKLNPDWFLNSPQCLCCGRITIYSTEVIWEGGDIWKAACHMLRASPWKRAAGEPNWGQPQRRRIKISMVSCTKMSQDGTSKINNNPLTYNIRRGKMVSDISYHMIMRVSSVVGGESNFINNIT